MLLSVACSGIGGLNQRWMVRPEELRDAYFMEMKYHTMFQLQLQAIQLRVCVLYVHACLYACLQYVQCICACVSVCVYLDNMVPHEVTSTSAKYEGVSK